MDQKELSNHLEKIISDLKPYNRVQIISIE